MIDPQVPLVTAEVPVGERIWRVTCVQNQDALLDVAETFEHFPFGFLLWESAVGLARRLAAAPEQVAGRSVLELGAGVGLPGIVAHALGGAVRQTDHQAGALALAQRNALQNGVTGITAFLADWRDWRHSTRYGVVLGADILYERSLHYDLERVFVRCIAPGGCLLLADPGRPQSLEFVARLEKFGWQVEMETQTVLLDGAAAENHPVEVVIWRLSRDE